MFYQKKKNTKSLHIQQKSKRLYNMCMPRDMTRTKSKPNWQEDFTRGRK